MPTFSEIATTRRHMQVMMWAKVSGLPYIFASHPIPAAWDAGGGTVVIDGETYTWDRSFLTENIDSIGAEVTPKNGITVTGGLNLEFKVEGNQGDPSSDVWLSLTNNSLHRTDRNYSTLKSDLSSSGTAAAVSTTAGWPSSGYIYKGTETSSYSGKTTDAFSGLVRGRFGSLATFHVGSSDTVSEVGFSGAHIADGPLVLEGRVVEVWLATGTVKNGVFTPYGASIGSSSDKQIYKGVIEDSGMDRGLMRVRLVTQSLDALLARPVLSRQPTANIGLDDPSKAVPWAYVQIDEGSNRLNFTVTSIAGGTAINATGENRLRLIREDGAGGTENVPAGVYHQTEVMSFIATTLTSHPDWPSTATTVGVVQDDSYKRTISVTMSGGGSTITFALTATTDDDVMRELGFTQGKASSSFSALTTIDFVCDKAAPLFRLPRTGAPGRRIYYQGRGPLAFDASPGFTDDYGNAVGGYVLVGEDEIVGFSSATDLGEGRGYLVLGARRAAGSGLTEDLYVEHNADEDASLSIKQVAYFPQTSTFRVALYLMLGLEGTGTNDATYDQGWRGLGAGIDSSLVDIDSFTELDDEMLSQHFRYHCITEPTELRTWFKDEAVANQCYITADSNSSGHAIRLRRVEPPNEDDLGATSTRELSHNTVDSLQGIDYDASTSRLINVVTVKTRYDAAAEKFGLVQHFRNATSIGTFVENEPLELELKGLRSVFWAGAPQKVANIIQGIWSAYAWPYVVLTFEVATFAAWEWAIGDVVSVTHLGLPALDNVGRGWEGVLGRIYRITKHYRRDESRASVTVLVKRNQGRRFGTWSPSARLTAKASDTIWTAAANAFSAPADGQDLDHFDEGDVVFYASPGADAAGFAIIASASGTAITFESPGIPASATQEIWAVNCSTSGIPSSQLLHAFIAGWDPPAQLDLFGGAKAAAYYYQ